MFEGFANVWSPVTLAKNLKAQPISVPFAGETIAFFRDASGTASALIDRCPHRGVKLSLGKVTADGCLECPFHAWRFDGRGNTCEVPLNPDAKREQLFAQALPVVEAGGLLWVYTAPIKVGEPAPPPPVMPEAFTMPGLARTYFEVDWACHWSRAMENMLDSPHVPYLHRKTIGRFVRPLLKPGSRMDLECTETDYGFRWFMYVDGNKERDKGYLDFYRPNIMVLHIPIPGKVFRMHSVCVPVGPKQTRMIIVGARSFATLPLLNPFFNMSNKKIAKEDQAVVESSQPAEIPPPSEEQSVRTDSVTLKFRKYYFDVLKPSSAQPRARISLARPHAS